MEVISILECVLYVNLEYMCTRRYAYFVNILWQGVYLYLLIALTGGPYLVWKLCMLVRFSPVQVLCLDLTTISIVGGWCYVDIQLKTVHENTDMELLLLLSQMQLEEEKELAKQQQEALDANCKKYDMLEVVVQNGGLRNLAHCYGVNLDDWWDIHLTAAQSSVCRGAFGDCDELD